MTSPRPTSVGGPPSRWARTIGTIGIVIGVLIVVDIASGAGPLSDAFLTGYEKRDFTLKADSPALKMGFKPISLRSVGPRPGMGRE